MALIILAGGKSTRMGGGDKALLPMGKETMVGMIITRLQPLFKEIFVVAKESAPYCEMPVQVIHDEYPGLGPISGIHAGLKASNDEYNFVVACDLPLIRVELVELLLKQAEPRESAGMIDVVIPKMGEFIEPVAAVYAGRILPTIEHFIRTGDYKVKNLIAELRTEFVSDSEMREVDPELESFLNVNTPEEYHKVLEIIGRDGR